MKPKYFIIIKNNNICEIFMRDHYDNYNMANEEIKKIKKNHNIELYVLKI